MSSDVSNPKAVSDKIELIKKLRGIEGKNVPAKGPLAGGTQNAADTPNLKREETTEASLDQFLDDFMSADN